MNCQRFQPHVRNQIHYIAMYIYSGYLFVFVCCFTSKLRNESLFRGSWGSDSECETNKSREAYIFNALKKREKH